MKFQRTADAHAALLPRSCHILPYRRHQATQNRISEGGTRSNCRSSATRSNLLHDRAVPKDNPLLPNQAEFNSAKGPGDRCFLKQPHTVLRPEWLGWDAVERRRSHRSIPEASQIGSSNEGKMSVILSPPPPWEAIAALAGRSRIGRQNVPGGRNIFGGTAVRYADRLAHSSGRQAATVRANLAASAVRTPENL